MSRITRAKPIEEVFRREKVGRLCRTRPVTAPPDASLGEVVKRLRGDSGGCVIIVRADPENPEGLRPVGIFTERDYLDKVALGGVALRGVASRGLGETEAGGARRIEPLMTPSPMMLSREATLGKAIELMTGGGYRHLPLVDDQGFLIGVLSARDIINFLAEFFPLEIMNLPPNLNQGTSTREGE